MANKYPIALLSGVLCIKNDKYLLVQEREDKPYTRCKGKWTLPHGGYDKDGESIHDLAKRELLEETSGEADFSGRFIILEGFEKAQNKMIVMGIIWIANNWRKVSAEDSDEISKTKYFSEEELADMETEGQIRDNFPILDVVHSIKSREHKILRWDVIRD